jgi:hypothetical protein
MPLQTAFDTALTRADARSDDRRRKIAFAGRSVVIARRVAMRVQVPLASYQGVRLSLGTEGQGETLHKSSCCTAIQISRFRFLKRPIRG